MIDTSTLAAFFGWCTVVNTVILCFTVFMLVAFKGFTSAVHSKFFGLEHADLNRAYFNYLACYKLGILIFNLTPYLVLRFMI